MHPDRDDEDALGPELTALERRLSGWRPAAATDRDRMLYQAGRAAAVAGARPWRLSTSALALATLGLSAMLIGERSHRRDLEMVLAARFAAPQPIPPLPAPSEAIEPPAPSSYLAMTARLVAGVDDPSTTRPSVDPDPREPSPVPEGGPLRSSPLRPHDLRRVLDL